MGTTRDLTVTSVGPALTLQVCLTLIDAGKLLSRYGMPGSERTGGAQEGFREPSVPGSSLGALKAHSRVENPDDASGVDPMTVLPAGPGCRGAVSA